ncbi:ABC transporter ATP-binding protein [Mahella sp.]|uniref:ABC transporter ATP-binding protein n=1 Tax=Mahella sp. TaxID=2798721 RepID=UPI0025C62AB5|nr:ABC transporter ATP-binding protein [Mahella sp.]MBZ4666396.1 transporter related protein [Mahella sp.]
MDIFKRLWGYIRPYKLQFVLTTAALLAAAGAGMINPYLTGLLIDRVVRGGQMELLWPLAVGLVVVSLAGAVLQYTHSYSFENLSQKVIYSIRHAMYRHLQQSSFSFYDRARTGELMSRLTGDLEGIRAFMVGGFPTLISSTVIFVGVTIILFNMNTGLTLVCLSFSPLLAVTAINFDRRIRQAYRDIRSQMATFNSFLQENITGIRVVKAFAREKYEIERFRAENNEVYKKNMAAGLLNGRFGPLLELLSGMSVVVLVCYGGWLVIDGEMTVGTLVAFNGYLWSLIWPMRQLGMLLNMTGQAISSGQRIFELLDTNTSMPVRPDAYKPEKVRGDVCFEDVTFKYEDNIVLQDINIDAPAGKKVAIMGATGAGKTSIVNLICRFYDPQKGRVMVDNVDVRDWDLKTLRRSVSVVMQETFLFSDTIANNIAYGKDDASMDEIIAAAKAACAHDFIMEMPEGYDTVVGERGVGLSGGQKQRIAIARALLVNAPILILDDATSSVDMETEHEIQQALKRLMAGRTTFIIAHRISAVKDADEIIILEKGCIAERGTHDQLLRMRGVYYDIFRDQYKDLVVDDTVKSRQEIERMVRHG